MQAQTKQQAKIQEFKRNHSAPIYYKSFDTKAAKISEDSRTVEFYFSVWGVRDHAGDVMVKGAFSKSIKEHGPESKSFQKILLLNQHDTTCPLGLPSEIVEDNYGAKAVVTLDMIEEADEVLTQLKSGTLNQFSFGFNYIWDKIEYDEATDSFIVKEVKLFEISVVSIGCNEDTHLIGFKSQEFDTANTELILETEAFIKSLDSSKQLQARAIIFKHLALNKQESPEALKEIIKSQNQKGDIKTALKSFTIKLN